MEHATLTVPDMTCGHCKASIEGALQKLDGVACQVDLDSKQVSVDFDPDQHRLDAIADAIEAQGFDVTERRSG